MTPPSNHTGNVVAIGAPIALWLAHAAPTITAICGLLGVAWYAVLFWDRFVKSWLKRKDNQL